jgi:hypothetical protein
VAESSDRHSPVVPHRHFTPKTKASQNYHCAGSEALPALRIAVAVALWVPLLLATAVAVWELYKQERLEATEKRPICRAAGPDPEPFPWAGCLGIVLAGIWALLLWASRSPSCWPCPSRRCWV